MEKTKKGYIVRSVVFIMFISAALFVGYSFGHLQAETAPIPANLTGVYNPTASTTDFGLFWKVWALLDQKFASSKATSTITDQDKLYGALKGLAAAYGDPYTVFFPPAETKEFESEIGGSFEGVGMEISIKDNILTVVAPLKGSPAEKAGMRAGDQIFKIDTTTTEGISVDQALKLIRGKKGTTVSLTIIHKGDNQPTIISIVRDTIAVPTLETSTLPGGIFNIRLYTFTSESPTLFRNAIRQFVTSGNKKLIIDLRGNPGGYLDAAVDMASWFLPYGNTVVTEEFKGTQGSIYHRSKGYNVIGQDVKTVILVDGGSASASEILAGALREYDKATLVGSQTFGKGSVQEYLQVSADTSLKVTVARWLTPKGVSISDHGITPDVVVSITQSDVEAGKDPQLDRAKQLLLNQK